MWDWTSTPKSSLGGKGRILGQTEGSSCTVGAVGPKGVVPHGRPDVTRGVGGRVLVITGFRPPRFHRPLTVQLRWGSYMCGAVHRCRDPEPVLKRGVTPSVTLILLRCIVLVREGSDTLNSRRTRGSRSLRLQVTVPTRRRLHVSLCRTPGRLSHPTPRGRH